MPHGLPGVASSMKRPNSGWKTGAVISVSLLCISMSSIGIDVRVHTSRIPFAHLALLPLLPAASHHWPEQPKCLPGAAKAEPCDALHRSTLQDIQSTVTAVSLIFWEKVYQKGATSSPHKRASRSFPLAFCHMLRSCCRPHVSQSGSRVAGQQTYFDSPCTDLTSHFFGFGPLQWRT